MRDGAPEGLRDEQPLPVEEADFVRGALSLANSASQSKAAVTEKEKPAMLQGYMKGRLKSEI